MYRYLILLLMCSFLFTSCFKKPEVKISCVKTTGSPGEDICFYNNSLNAKNYYWDFGDGCTSNGEEEDRGFLKHSYSDIGTYTVTVTAYKSNIENCDSQSIVINIVENETGTFTDPRDGQVYKTVMIDNVLWMAENLNYNSDSGCWVYDEDTINGHTYGKLYNWETAMNAAPPGWHIATQKEWEKLIYLYGYSSVAGGKLKDTILWNEPNLGATNGSGFSILPGGYKSESFTKIGEQSMFWSSVEGRPYLLYYDKERIDECSIPNNYGCYVRCVSDELFLD